MKNYFNNPFSRTNTLEERKATNFVSLKSPHFCKSLQLIQTQQNIFLPMSNIIFLGESPSIYIQSVIHID